MQKNCPSCGTETFPGARFCRRCGALVRDAAPEGTGDVSPQAATVPLGGEAEGRTTEGLAPSDEQGSAQTSRVSLAEMERLLRTQQQSAPQRVDPEATRITPSAAAHPSAATRPDVPTAEHDEELIITVPRSAQTRASGDFDSTIDFEATHASDFETTRAADFETTRPADLDATRPSTAMLSQSKGVTRDDALAFGADVSTVASSDGASAAASSDAARPHVEGASASSAGAASTTERPGATAGVTHRRDAGQRRTWPVVVVICAAALVFIVGGAWLALRLLRRPAAVTDLPTQAPTAPVATTDTRQQFDEKLADAEALLAGGNMEAAVARLREANALDPTNSRAHRRLAELLLSTGARREAIEELRAVTRAEPEDFNVWRQLAATQFAEGLHRDAAESYRRLVALVGEQAVDPADLLSYADALRLSGRAEESRALYARLASATPTDIAVVARQHLSELARAAEPSPTPHTGEQVAEQQSPRESEAASSALPSTQPTPAQPAPTPTPPTTPPPARTAEASPAEHYTRGSGLWSSNRAAALEEFRAAAAGGNYDAHYYLGLSYVEGKNPHALKRAEVVAALQHFQLAQRGRQYVAESHRYEQQLEKEFDRLRKQ
ncbi:MAG: Tetratricopeptide repeat [Acidobacteriota bacterium]|jgi:tetratricopeptide (TPR) repeat protein|nr:Tetratricopeptide repeat [Acidobacteriota bacterium]